MENTVQAVALTGCIIESFLDNPRFSDLIIKSGTKSWKAHKVILARGSTYLRKMLCGQFEEADKKEIELLDDAPDAVHAMLRFLYNMPCLFRKEGQDQWVCLSVHAHVYAAAEKCSLPDLEKSVAHEMGMLLQTQKPTHNELLPTLKIIWNSTTSTDLFARPILATYCAKNLEAFQESPEFIRVMRDTELGADIALATIDVNKKKKAEDKGGEFASLTVALPALTEILYGSVGRPPRPR